ncbi:nuclear transport factor 2 family protein [Nocardia puris]|uniref:Putative SnoaL-like aldol condensation-catalyzing enzyme n=1 Tax=Nocardia puris TaxID=208602 RepID=A0A366DJU8_9NOCA|nr:nuclear transport factor 2 family protein [Nocardia puris]MBF6213107.1 nuclear transport factor 2 family protein [Nocardia puris]MBF6368097.1 nuclear transport factor 2 family protein [Nocardia puris]MBF6462731.1 nuclear transport factor 2 family protein [Nocardia puris]RBO90352.1 putative SnoaL-like aldol condensation-catalyzing enzyme [Nocardia puris]
MTPLEIVDTALTELFGDRDPAAVDRWVAPDYRQHSSLAADGPDALRTLVAGLPADFRYERARILADGDLVAVHGTWYGFGPVPLVGFDLFRVADGKLAEHWDALTPLVTPTVSGRSQTDGPTEVTDRAATEANRALVADFADKVFVGADYSVLTDYISTEQYDQHNPEAADGLDGFAAATAGWASQGKNLVYKQVHRIVADGAFVLVQSEGEFGVPAAYYDLFRVADGKIVEHWDVIAPIPGDLPHGNGMF